MRVTITANGKDGQLSLEATTVLHYNENGKVRKFYQQFLIRFDPDDNSSRAWWSVSNWGAGVPNDPHLDLKGQVKVTVYGGERYAQDANRAQVNSKINRGYEHATSHYNTTGVVEPQAKILTAIGARPVSAGRPVLRPGKTVPAFTAPKATRVDKRGLLGERALLSEPKTVTQQNLADLQVEVNDFAEVILNALGDGDLPRAISHRVSLLNLIAAVKDLYDNAEGQLEVVNAKLAAAL